MLTNRKIGVQRYDFFLEKDNELLKLFEEIEGKNNEVLFFNYF
jgi:hypothetical protein